MSKICCIYIKLFNIIVNKSNKKKSFVDDYGKKGINKAVLSLIICNMQETSDYFRLFMRVDFPLRVKINILKPSRRARYVMAKRQKIAKQLRSWWRHS